GTDIIDKKGVLAQRYDGKTGAIYLIRPDQHIAARWRSFEIQKITTSLAKALGSK
ncbi:MAG: hypothetical protein JKY10_07640, partial [Cohaesibacteraceae bacterium]|nr:hypothetical protein [Cohaesibacteraceae bacterium]